MSSAQAVSVHHNLLQLLSTEAAAFSGLNLDSSSQDGLFSEAMLSSMKEQGMLMTGAVGAEPGGMDLPAIGDDLPSGGESLAAILQQSLNGGQLDLQRLEAAGLDGQAIESSALEVVQLLAAAGRGDESALDDLDKAFQQLQQLMGSPASSSTSQSEVEAELEVRPGLGQRNAPDQLFAGQQGVIADGNQPVVDPADGIFDRRAAREPLSSTELPAATSTSSAATAARQQDAPAEVLRRQREARADAPPLVAEPGASAGRPRTAESVDPVSAVAPAASASASVSSEARDVDRVGPSVAAEQQIPAVDRVGESGGFDSAGRDRADMPRSAAAETALAQNQQVAAGHGQDAEVIVAPPAVATAAEQVSLRNAAGQGELSRPDVTPAQALQQSAGAAEGSTARVAMGEDKAAQISASAQNQNGSSAGEQRGEGESSRQESFRNNMAAIRAELAAAGAGLGESAEKFTPGVSGFTSIAGGRGGAEEGAARNIPAVSNFQQLQSTYKGDAVGEVSLNLPERFGSEKWTPGLSQRVVWMSNQQVGHAELRLDPPDLGSLNIRLTIQNDQASLSFTSPHAHVREVLEQQMPRLREMLAENGIELQHSDVSDQSSSQQSNKDQDSAPHAMAGSAVLDESFDEMEGLGASSSASLSMVDFYA